MLVQEGAVWGQKVQTLGPQGIKLGCFSWLVKKHGRTFHELSILTKMEARKN